MPVMTGVHLYLDPRANVSATRWRSLISNEEFQLFSPTFSKDSVEVVGSSNSYGMYTKQYVSGSSRTWYVVFKNTSNVFTNWRTIFGNESGTYTCSTIAMNGAGYIQFTRPEIYQSTYKCNDWHVVAWCSNGSNNTTRLWIDGVFIGNASLMRGFATDTYLARGSSWYFSDNNTKFRFIAFSNVAQSDNDIVTNSNFLKRYFITEYDENIVVFPERKYLVKSGSTIYTVQNGSLVALPETTITGNLFSTYGVDTVPSSALLLTLTDPILMYWDSDDEAIHILSATMTAVPYPQILFSQNHSMTHSTIDGISGATVTGSADCLFAISFDNGTTWKMWNGSAWVTATANEGMTASTVNGISSNDWNTVAITGMYKVRVIIPTDTSSVTSFVIHYINE